MSAKLQAALVLWNAGVPRSWISKDLGIALQTLDKYMSIRPAQRKRFKYTTLDKLVRLAGRL